jgi:hypothetical protein
MLLLMMVCCILDLTSSHSDGDLVVPIFQEDGTAVPTLWSSTDSDEELWHHVSTYHCPRFSLSPEACQVHGTYILEQVSMLRKADFLGDVGLEYVAAVEDAVQSDELFASFKSHPAYMYVVENHSHEECLKYSGIVARHSPSFLHSPHPHVDTLRLLQLLADNDAVGHPPVRCGLIGYPRPPPEGSQAVLAGNATAGLVLDDAEYTTELSASTAVYMKVASDLDQLFLLFRGGHRPAGRALSIAEIGVGYGGQAQAIYAVEHSRLAPDSGLHYYLYDLPAVLELARKYTQRFPWMPPASLHFMGPATESAPPERFDLCLSYCAVSELSRDLQLHYIRTVLSRCRESAGVVLFNNLEYLSRARGLGRAGFVQALEAEFGAEVPVYWVVDSRPPHNTLITWGNRTAFTPEF